jgi:hypothetical protein
MKICYIILTREKWFVSKLVAQQNTFLKYVSKNDIVYISSNNESTLNIMKRISHLTTMNNDYDWYVFLNDGAFVFHNRLQIFLNQYDANIPTWVGRYKDDLLQKRWTFINVVSKAMFDLLSAQYFPKLTSEKMLLHWNEDVWLGIDTNTIIANNLSIVCINNIHFCSGQHLTDIELDAGITFCPPIDYFDFYNSILNQEATAFVSITDKGYFRKAEQTIKDLRNRGNWHGVVVLVTIDFDLTEDFKNKYDVIEWKFASIDKTHLLNKIGSGFSNSDKREINKLNQWEKLHIFDEYFTAWPRVVFLDAGLRVLDDVRHLLELDFKDAILAPDDSAPYYRADKIFRHQVCFDNPEHVKVLTDDFGEKVFDSKYFLNCIWVYDTNILKTCNKTQLIDAMNKYPLCKTNEMTIMNLLFHFKYKLWKDFPLQTTHNKYLFEWCESNHPFPTKWSDYCFIKYPITIAFDV